jgi:8-oxo-dGTP diphosphatase / 2-hydroxy-dATP diphosphatase
MFISFQEEAGILAPLVHVGVYLFLTEDVPWAFHIDIYRANNYEGQATEYSRFSQKSYSLINHLFDLSRSDEMRPVWFCIPNTPSSLTKPIAEDDAGAVLTPSTVLESTLPMTVTAPAVANEEPLPKIPYNQMWEGDYLWLPLLLSGQKFIGRADFTNPSNQAISQTDNVPTEARLSKWWFATIDE